MNLIALERLRDVCQEQKLAALLLSNPATITWLSGYAPPIQTGPNPFEGGPALAWWLDNELTLVLSDMETAVAQAQGIQVRDYVAYSVDGPMAGFSNQAVVLNALLSASHTLTGKVGVEMDYLPAAFVSVLNEALPSAALLPIDGDLDGLRAVKSLDELRRIRAALEPCDLAQAETSRLIQPGVSEIEVWGQLKSRLEKAAGSRLPILADFVAGLRTADIGGLPGTYKLNDGDAVIADIVPRLNGYWGDNAGTHFVGVPVPELDKMYRASLDALRMGIDAVKPGLRANDLDTLLRSAIEQQGYPPYPHHSGHGLGTTYHEEPRLVPYNTLALEPGMVVAIEPGIYLPGVGGVRLEDVVLVTADGCEVLTRHLGNG